MFELAPGKSPLSGMHRWASLSIVPRKTVRVLLSVGSNVRRRHHLRVGLRRLQALLGPLACSRVYESAAVGLTADPFYNVVIAARTVFSLPDLLGVLKALEVEFGRDRSTPAAITLDIDVLTYGDFVGRVGQWELPRRDIVKHAFVLAPLPELCPRGRHPADGRTFAALWSAFKHKQDVRVSTSPIVRWL